MSIQTPWRAVIFDLDGTLIDSAQTILSIINEMREERAGNPIGMIGVRPHLSKGGRQLVAEALGAYALDPEGDLCSFRRRYADRRQGPEIVFPHSTTTLRALSDMGLALAICTNKPTRLAHNALQHSGLIDFFNVVVSSDEVGTHKPDPKPLLETCVRLCFDPKDCLYIGDSEADAVAAERAGIDFVFASYGYPIGNFEGMRLYGRVDCLSEIQDFFAVKAPATQAKLDLEDVAG